MDKEKFLPIGTVVLLDGGTKKVMITCYLIYGMGTANKKIFDYGGCVFPEGIIDGRNTLGFNRDQIREVVHMGLEDDEQKKFIESLSKVAGPLRDNIERELNS